MNEVLLYKYRPGTNGARLVHSRTLCSGRGRSESKKDKESKREREREREREGGCAAHEEIQTFITTNTAAMYIPKAYNLKTCNKCIISNSRFSLEK